MSNTRQASIRFGFSLMEMILATAILAGSGAALFALIGSGSMYGRRAEDRAEALRLAENLLAEAAATVVSEGDNGGQFETSTPADDSATRWIGRVTRLDVSQTESLPLIGLAVEVALQSEPDKPVCRLVRWVRSNSRAGSSQTSSSFGGGPSPSETFGEGS